MGELVGRDAELRVAEGFLDGAAGGLSVLLLEGEAGIGKSTVWQEAVRRARARGFLVLSCRASAAETDLTLASLADLLEPVDDADFDALPPPQRRALDRALLRVEAAGDSIEQRLVGTAVRTLLRHLSARQPVVLAIDDAQWLDGSSAATIGFALRRLPGSPIGLLATQRAGEAASIRVADIAGPDVTSRLEVRPLSVAALHHVLKERLGSAPARSTLVRIHEASRGNPLFAIEIARLLADVGVPPVGQPLPVTADVRELVRRRIVQLPDATREVLLAAAAVGHASVHTVRAALGRDVREDLGIPEVEGIARIEADRIVFAHPLFAAAIHGAADADQRHAVHARLALAVDGAEEAARHRALAATGPDAAVALALEQAARAAVGRGAPDAAADLVELAIGLTPADDRAAREERSIALGGYLQRSGDLERAGRVLEAVIEAAEPGPARARAQLDLAAIRFDADAGPAAARLAEAAVVDSGDDLATRARAHATLAAVLYEDRRAASWHAREGMRLLEQLPDPDPIVASHVLRAWIGLEVDSGHAFPQEAVDRAIALERVAPLPNVGDRLTAALGFWLKSADDLDGARHWLEATYAAAVDEGDEGSVAYALSHLPTLELAAGDWPRAEALALRHLEVSTELGLESQRLQALFNVALVQVHLGRVSEARAATMELIDVAERAEDHWSVANGLGALGALELARGDAVAAVPHLLRMTGVWDMVGLDTPRRHDPDVVDSLLATGDLDRAAAAVEAMTARATASGRRSSIAQAARARGVLAAAAGDTDAAVLALEEAVALHDAVPMPFERARTLLALGQVRRRRRERSAAKAAIEASLAVFESLGAVLWAERARAELDRIGLRRVSAWELTEGERRVAELAASGLTNREVAAALFMSPKTVEANLARAYRKLGVTSRAGLGAVMAAGATPAGAPREPPVRA